MSTIVWTLVIVLNGWGASPTPVEITFNTKQDCEAAKETVKGRLYSIKCVPKEKS
jgi:hypothetical protein